MSGGQVTGAFIQAHSIGKVEVHGGPAPGTHPAAECVRKRRRLHVTEGYE